MKTFKQLREQNRYGIPRNPKVAQELSAYRGSGSTGTSGSAPRTRLTLSPGSLGLSAEGPGTTLPKSRSREDNQALRRIQSAGLDDVPYDISPANRYNYMSKDFTPAKQQAFKTVDALARETKRLETDLKKREEELGQKAGALTNVIARSSVGDDVFDVELGKLLGNRSDLPYFMTVKNPDGSEEKFRTGGLFQTTVTDPENRGGYGTKVRVRPQKVDVTQDQFKNHPYFRVTGAKPDAMVPTPGLVASGGSAFTRNSDLPTRSEYYARTIGSGNQLKIDGKTVVSDDVFAQMQQQAKDAAVGDNEELNLMKAELDAAKKRREDAARLLGFGN